MEGLVLELPRRAAPSRISRPDTTTYHYSEISSLLQPATSRGKFYKQEVSSPSALP